MTLVQMADAVARYFAERQIDTYGFTLILNFQDFQSAGKLDAAVRRELAGMTHGMAIEMDTTAFKLNGLEVRIESPVHVRLLP